SAFALNPLLIDLHDLVAHEWLEEADAQQASALAAAPGAAPGASPGATSGAVAKPAEAPAAKPAAAIGASTGSCHDHDRSRERIDYAVVTRFRMACLAAAA